MIITNDQLNEFTLHATDGMIGSVKDLFMDDVTWAIKYLVVETGNWFTRHRVLIPTAALGSIDTAEKAIQVKCSREQVQGSPDVDCEMPVSRQKETDLSGYYGFPPHLDSALRRDKDPHLRSAHALRSYVARSANDEIGTVRQFLVDDDGWRAVAVILKTGAWWHSDLLRIDTDGIESVDWETKSLSIIASRESLQDEPPHEA